MDFQIIFNIGYIIVIFIVSFITVKVKTNYLEEQIKELHKLCEQKEVLMGEMNLELAKVKTKALTELQARQIFVSKEEFGAHLKRLDEMDKMLREKLDYIINLLIKKKEE